jgi:hypothetical protein
MVGEGGWVGAAGYVWLVRWIYHALTHLLPALVCTLYAGFHFLPQAAFKWAIEGSKHVENPLKDDKRQFTGAIWASGAGDIVFLECITAGKTARSMATPAVRAKFPKIQFQVTPNHWASRATKEASTLRLWNFAVDKKAVELGGVSREAAAKETRIILMLDCWPVNHTAEYREFVKQKCPGMRLLFIPAGATGKFQVSLGVGKKGGYGKEAFNYPRSPLPPPPPSLTLHADRRHRPPQAVQGSPARVRQRVAASQGAALRHGRQRG